MVKIDFVNLVKLLNFLNMFCLNIYVKKIVCFFF